MGVDERSFPLYDEMEIMLRYPELKRTFEICDNRDR